MDLFVLRGWGIQGVRLALITPHQCMVWVGFFWDSEVISGGGPGKRITSNKAVATGGLQRAAAWRRRQDFSGMNPAGSASPRMTCAVRHPCLTHAGRHYGSEESTHPWSETYLWSEMTPLPGQKGSFTHV